MSIMSGNTEQSTAGNQSEKQICRVKWFNGKSGYGFATTVDEPVRDIFIHHSAVEVASEQYKYLVPGEYVDLFVEASDEDGKWQATKVTGVRGGPLQCETKLQLREEYEQRGEQRSEDDDGGEHRSAGRQRQHGSSGGSSGGEREVRGRRGAGGGRRVGGGPRDDGEWVLTRRR